jgi:hypothetical protein
MTGTTLLDWIQNILRDPTERAAFQADPDDYADRHGFGDLSPTDVHDALWLIADNQNTSWEHGNGQVHFPPPTPIHQHTDAGGYLNSYITYNYTAIDTRDTDVDNSVHQDVDTDRDDRYYGHRDDQDRDDDRHDRDDRDHDDRDRDHDRDGDARHDDHDGGFFGRGDGLFGRGDDDRHDDHEDRDGHDGRDDHDGGDFNQHIDSDTVLASGDGATAIGGDNDGNISSAGHDSTTAFGDGDAVHADLSDTDFGSGSAVNVGGGSASGNAEVNTEVDVQDSFQDNDTHEDNDSVHVADDSTDDHSNTHIDADSHNDTHIDDVHHI